MGTSKPKNSTAFPVSESARNTLIARFTKANDVLMNNMKRDTWKVASTAYQIVHSANYKKAFKNNKDFAESVGYTPGAMSKLLTVAELNIKYELSSRYNMTIGQVQELIPLWRSDEQKLLEYLENNGDNFNTMTSKDIRRDVKDKLADICPPPSDCETTEKVESMDIIDAEELAPEHQDEAIRSNAEILNEIRGIMLQAEETEIMKLYDEENYVDFSDAIVSVYKAIESMLKGEGLL